MVKVCDAIMGTGKSQSAITYMNEHSDSKFIYITPYLDEANRIKKGCPNLRFVEPSSKISKYGFRKSIHTAALIKDGRNITTTHQAFKNYTSEVLSDIQKQEYTLIIDENVNVTESCDIDLFDLQNLIELGYIVENEGVYSIGEREYKGVAFSELFQILKSRNLIYVDNNNDGTEDIQPFYWTLPSNLITSFKEVIILTYLFEGQSLCNFLKIHKIPYDYIGVERTDNGNGFRFCESRSYVPEYVSYLEDMLNIFDNKRINSIGNGRYALSMNWFKKHKKDVDKLKKNTENYFGNIHRDIPANHKLWTTYNDAFSKVKGKGYTKGFLTNKYKDRDCLAYLVNVFMNTGEKIFYQKHGVKVNEDAYALSTMVQWIWRSAIRDGKKVNLYIPSERMRTILKNWIKETSNGGNIIE